MNKAISHIGAISLIAILLGVLAVGILFSYSLSNHTTAQANAVTLQSFSLNPSTSNLTGNIKVNSNSPLMRMSLYVNGTFMGSFNYSNHYGMMYPYAYSMMYSWYPSSMPMMRNYPFMAGRTYMIKIMATLEDGSVCNATTFVHP